MIIKKNVNFSFRECIYEFFFHYFVKAKTCYKRPHTFVMGDRVLRAGAGQNLNLHINMASQTKKKEEEERKKQLRDSNYIKKTPRTNLMWI